VNSKRMFQKILGKHCSKLGTVLFSFGPWRRHRGPGYWLWRPSVSPIRTATAYDISTL